MRGEDATGGRERFPPAPIDAEVHDESVAPAATVVAMARFIPWALVGIVLVLAAALLWRGLDDDRAGVGDGIIVGLDAKDGKVAVEGWSKVTGHDVVDLAKRFEDYGVESVVYTDGDRYIPLGGAKGGIDCDPYDPRSREVLGRFGRAMKPLIQTLFATGEDFGVRQDVIDEVFADEGIRSSAESALALHSRAHLL